MKESMKEMTNTMMMMLVKKENVCDDLKKKACEKRNEIEIKC